MPSESAGALRADRRPAGKFIFVGGKLLHHQREARIIYEKPFNVIHEQCVQYTMCTVHNVYSTQCVQYTLCKYTFCTVHNVYSTQFVLYTTLQKI